MSSVVVVDRPTVTVITVASGGGASTGGTVIVSGVDGKRLGEAVTLPNVGHQFTGTDGSVWRDVSGTPLAYSSTYSALLTDARAMVSAAQIMPGPLTGGKWPVATTIYTTSGVIGPSNGTWVLLPSNGNGAAYYHTSTDGGATWTARVSPVASKSWVGVWDGTNYVLYAGNTGATGAQESTDGITWTARTAVSNGASDIVFLNSQYVVVSQSSSAIVTSPDRATWTARTLAATAPAYTPAVANQAGLITWNAGAGLYVMATSTFGQYQTSPDAVTWTARATLSQYIELSTSPRVASSATTTVMVGAGIALSSTDCINWTAARIDTGLFNAPTMVYHDGTRFVAVFNGPIFYSTDGLTWTRSSNVLGGAVGFNIARTPTGLLLPQVGLHLTDVTSTDTNTIYYPSTPVAEAGTRTYTRIA